MDNRQLAGGKAAIEAAVARLKPPHVAFTGWDDRPNENPHSWTLLLSNRGRTAEVRFYEEEIEDCSESHLSSEIKDKLTRVWDQRVLQDPGAILASRPEDLADDFLHALIDQRRVFRIDGSEFTTFVFGDTFTASTDPGATQALDEAFHLLLDAGFAAPNGGEEYRATQQGRAFARTGRPFTSLGFSSATRPALSLEDGGHISGFEGRGSSAGSRDDGSNNETPRTSSDFEISDVMSASLPEIGSAILRSLPPRYQVIEILRADQLAPYAYHKFPGSPPSPSFEENARISQAIEWLIQHGHLRRESPTKLVPMPPPIAGDKWDNPATEPQVSELASLVANALMIVSKDAASSYLQAQRDLMQPARLSYRGPVHDIREAVRLALDALAPEADVMAAPGFQLEPDQKKPTHRQKARFAILRRGGKPTDAGLRVATVVEELISHLARDTYTDSSARAHSGATAAEALQLESYATAFLGDLLGVYHRERLPAGT